MVPRVMLPLAVVATLGLAGLTTVCSPLVALPNAPANGQGATADAIAALENLGVGRSEALGAIAAAARRLGSEAGADVLIKAGLEELGR